MILVSIPVATLLLIEGCFALRFQREYAGTSLEVQSKWRFVASPHRGYKNNPGYVRKLDGVAYRYNDYGFRQESDYEEKKPGEFRVFVLGGSTAYGNRGLDYDQYQLISGQKTYGSGETISAYLEEALASALPDRPVRVINAAVVSYRLNNNYMTYLELLRDLSPDLLVSIDGVNEKWESGNPYSVTPTFDSASQSGGILVTWLRAHSYALFYLGQAYRESSLYAMGRRNIVELDEDALAAMDAVEIRRQLLREAEAYEMEPDSLGGVLKVYEQFWHATRLDDVPILFAVQPLPTLDPAKSFTPKENDLLKYLHFKEDVWPQLLHLDRALASRAAGDPSFHFVSLLDVFRDYGGDAYTDHCHLTPGANRHLAERIKDYILSVPEWTASGEAHSSLGREAH